MGLRVSDNAISMLIEALESELGMARQQLDRMADEKIDCLKFIVTDPAMMRGFAEFICAKYAGKPDKIKSALDYLHDSYMDMSKITGCKDIFKSWN